MHVTKYLSLIILWPLCIKGEHHMLVALCMLVFRFYVYISGNMALYKLNLGDFNREYLKSQVLYGTSKVDLAAAYTTNRIALNCPAFT